jgi:hypothetical protein
LNILATVGKGEATVKIEVEYHSLTLEKGEDTVNIEVEYHSLSGGG